MNYIDEMIEKQKQLSNLIIEGVRYEEAMKIVYPDNYKEVMDIIEGCTDSFPAMNLLDSDTRIEIEPQQNKTNYDNIF